MFLLQSWQCSLPQEIHGIDYWYKFVRYIPRMVNHCSDFSRDVQILLLD